MDLYTFISITLGFIAFIIFLRFIYCIFGNVKDKMKNLNIEAKHKDGHQFNINSNFDNKIKEVKKEILNSDSINEDKLLNNLNIKVPTQKEYNYKEAIKKYKAEIYNLKNKYINKTIYIAFLYIVLNWEAYTRKVFRKVIFKNGIGKYEGQKYFDYKQEYINNIVLAFNQLLQKSEIKSLQNKELSIILNTNILLFNMELNRIFDDIKNRHADAEKNRIKVTILSIENYKNNKEIIENDLQSINDFNETLREIEDSILNKDIKELKEFILGNFLSMLKNNFK
ncbi:hypothetical protein [Brachyspira hyodysenteriae]|uniref:hypothetical protein n=2 Tax=Brachyspira hyodysenteriae TaxID=159 RepID=UPI00063D929C|nr:hypothetical protein [Brachyspira hyodysenteriae]KLI18293.1 hypothetical protein SU45_03085 [Brachyspira hyodysenteriae]KLI22358.1 hypothetical protein SU43_08595 [Brachyspira hyodysenteriae]KLI61659.1 hypothetical protein SZ44_00035 [Brachyspira hyodysenteriae]MDA0063397.1 hypothetical protein [Brachyspira hyodysenteriae]MDA0064129.1 hypothetical protein [Brachyspira hyodysenteriae]